MSINEQPLVTVYIPTFNRLELLQRAVESVRNQTYKNLEIIVVDDCSTDGTQEYLVELSKEDERVRYFLKEKNSGACVSRNIAIENATGEFITGLDDDDYFEINRIEGFVNNSNLLEEYIFLCSRYKYKKNNIIIERKFYNSIISPIINKECLLFNNKVGNQIFIKSKVLKENKFNIDMPLWQDIYCWYGILIKYKSKGFSLKNDTYIIDTSHEHERMTIKKKDRVLFAYSKFCEDFKLNSREKKVLYCQLEHYGWEIKMQNLIYAFLKNFNLYTTYIMASRLVSKIKSLTKIV